MFHTYFNCIQRDFIADYESSVRTSIFETVANAVATANFQSPTSQQVAGTQISYDPRSLIQIIMDSLATANSSACKSFVFLPMHPSPSTTFNKSLTRNMK